MMFYVHMSIDAKFDVKEQHIFWDKMTRWCAEHCIGDFYARWPEAPSLNYTVAFQYDSDATLFALKWS